MCRRAGSARAYRSRAGTEDLSDRHGPHGPLPFRLCHARRRFLVRSPDARARRRRLGRCLHARSEGDRRSARRCGAVTRRIMACRRRRHRRRRVLRRRRSLRCSGRATGGVSLRRGRRGHSLSDCRDDLAGHAAPPCSRIRCPARFSAGVPQPPRHGVDRRLHRAYLGARRTSCLGGHLPHRHRRTAWRSRLAALARRAVHGCGSCRRRHLGHRQRDRAALRTQSGR